MRAQTTPAPLVHSGPKGNLLTGNVAEYGRDPLATLLRWHREYGDLVPVRFGPFRAWFAFAPELVEEALVTRNRDFRKSIGTRMLIPLLGHGLLTAEGDFWLRQRRLAQPAFHRERVASYGRTMVEYTQQHLAEWRDGETRDLQQEMMALTLRIVARVLYDADVTPGIARIASSGQKIQDHLADRFNSWRFLLPHWLPTPGNRRFHRAISELDELVIELIRRRRAEVDTGVRSPAGGEAPDLLGVLLAARDEDGRALSDRQVRDEVMTLLLAGHETTALALSWGWMLLAQHPEAMTRLQTEVDEVLAGRPATVEDVPRLSYTGWAVNEIMRLYPPAYATGRDAISDTSIGGVSIKKGQTVYVSQWATHRDGGLFPEPEAFKPERWADDAYRRLPRGAFFPFGLGPRKCIGADFAVMEATLLLATIAQRWSCELLPDQDLSAVPAITLRPAAGITAKLVVRAWPRAA